ncbi:MAG: GIY-YIG nuclease family protein [Gloeomargaritaceae cyanobacterium C42_A2020_066]|nr:GIY-YIG nuclease family protein [Gloeomargaritaceae cyanobacterium C42_A2020_066]
MAEPQQPSLFTTQEWRVMAQPGRYVAGQAPVHLDAATLNAWKTRIATYQATAAQGQPEHQPSLLAPAAGRPHPALAFDPLSQPSQGDAFYRLPPQFGTDAPCLYFVLDRAAALVLYIGETQHSRQRWAGHHDCKRYLTNYLNLHRQYGLETRIAWAFAWDVPPAGRERKALEAALIQRWWPPFNQEAWRRWGAPFRSGYQAAQPI